MRLNETKRKQRTSQEEVLAELFAEAELQVSVRKKKNWDAWMEQEEAQQIEKEMQVYLEEYSDQFGSQKRQEKRSSGRRDQLFHTILRDAVPRMPSRHRQKPENRWRKECRVQPLLLQAAHPRLLRLH